MEKPWKEEKDTDGKEPAEARKRKSRSRHGRCEELKMGKKAKRTNLIQIKVAPNLKDRAEQRAACLDMGLSEYVRFLLYCDIHGYSQTREGPAAGEESA